MSLEDYIALVVLGVFFTLVVFGAGVIIGYEVHKFITNKNNRV